MAFRLFSSMRRRQGVAPTQITLPNAKRLLRYFLKSLAIAICNGGERGIRTLVGYGMSLKDCFPYFPAIQVVWPQSQVKPDSIIKSALDFPMLVCSIQKSAVCYHQLWLRNRFLSPMVLPLPQ